MGGAIPASAPLEWLLGAGPNLTRREGKDDLMKDRDGRAGTSTPGWRRWMPLLLLALGLAVALALDLDRFASFEALRSHRAWLLAEVAERPVRSALLFYLVYAAVTALSIPGAVVLTLAGGFMFGTALGTVLVVAGATTGGTLVFLAARSALAGLLRRRAGPFLTRMEAGFRENAFQYLLVLRLIPVFPFWLVNLVPAFFGMNLGAYLLATLIGIIPASIVFTSLGSGLGTVFEAGRTPDLDMLARPELLLPLLGLALLALVPVLYRRFGRAQPRPNGSLPHG